MGREVKPYLVRDIVYRGGKRVGAYTTIMAHSQREAADLFMQQKHGWQAGEGQAKRYGLGSLTPQKNKRQAGQESRQIEVQEGRFERSRRPKTLW